MEFIKNALSQIEIEENNLYNLIYNLFFVAKLKESEDSIKNGDVCTLEELKNHIDRIEEEYENYNIKWC